MDFKINIHGRIEASFLSPISIDNGYTNKYQGDFLCTMELWTHLDGDPYMIEWVVGDEEMVEHIGLWFDDDKNLIDYDGVFELPHQAIKLIERTGYSVPKIYRNNEQERRS